MAIKPLISYPAITVGRAFVLNSLAVALATGLGIASKYGLDQVKELNDLLWVKLLLVIVITFIAALSSYGLLYLIFGFGRGMLAV